MRKFKVRGIRQRTEYMSMEVEASTELEAYNIAERDGVWELEDDDEQFTAEEIRAED